MFCGKNRIVKMYSRSIYCSALLLTLSAIASATEVKVDAQASARFFEEKIRPVLVDRCYACHSVEKGKSKGKLLVDSREGLLKGGETGPAIVPGDLDKSLLIKAIRQLSEEFRMPPEDRLSPQQVADFEHWVKDGAVDPRKKNESPAPAPASVADVNLINWDQARQFWSFQPVKDSTPPTLNDAAWSKSPIDQFILAKLREKKLAPAPLASKQILLRRATFDLTGLPPTPEEIDACLADNAPNAFEKIIDRLLASPQYGERWGRHWLDVARYADTEGDSADYPVPQAYKYRNYVIDAFNADVPYDRFIQEQIAGDLLPAKDENERRKNIVATGFVALSKRFSVAPEQAMHLTIDDTLDTTARAVLGLTVSCARCHDHKFDPLTQQDYYALYGFFSSSKYPFPGSEENHRPYGLIPLASKETVDNVVLPYETKFKSIGVELKRLEKEHGELERQPQSKERGDKLAENDKLRKELGAERKNMDAHPPAVEFAYGIQDGEAKDEKVHKRGEAFNLGDEAPRRFLQVLGGQPLPKAVRDQKGSGRLELARWLCDAKNPLTARVMANRVWQFHFGKGLVATSSDFGKQGARPTHPELLDWLAARLVEGGWSIKKLHKLMMLTQTYQLAADGAPENMTVDPGNDYLWRYARQRLDAEAIRDAMLFVAGNLDRTPGAEQPFPPRNNWNYTQHDPFNAVYPSNKRSVYLMQQRIKKHPFLALFDGADSNTPTNVRALSTTPIQALFMMNDPFVHEAGARFADRLMQENPGNAARVSRAVRLAFGRDARADEVTRGLDFIAEYAARAKASPLPLERIEPLAWAAYARVLMSSNEFLFVE